MTTHINLILDTLVLLQHVSSISKSYSKELRPVSATKW